MDINNTHTFAAPLTDEIEEIDVWSDDFKSDPYVKENEMLTVMRKGMLGFNVGFNTGSKLLNKFISGIHKGMYYLIGADSGVGKTTLTDFFFVYNLWKDAKARGKKIHIKYFSFELAKLIKHMKWMSIMFKEKHGIFVTTDYLRGNIKGRLLTEKHMRMTEQTAIEMRDFYEAIDIIDITMTPNAILNKMLAHYRTIGTILYTENEDGTQYISGFKANDEEEITILVIDHIGLVEEESKQTLKHAMDKLSKYIVHLRNIFGMIGVVVQQFNPEMEVVSRAKKKMEESDVTPSRQDFSDTKATYRDADVVLALVRPFNYDLIKYRGYDLLWKYGEKEPVLGEYFMALHLIKNRYGKDSIMIPLFANFISGTFTDLVEPTDFQGMQYFLYEATVLTYWNRFYAPAL